MRISSLRSYNGSTRGACQGVAPAVIIAGIITARKPPMTPSRIEMTAMMPTNFQNCACFERVFQLDRLRISQIRIDVLSVAPEMERRHEVDEADQA